LALKFDQLKPELSQNIPNPAENQTIIPYFIPGETFNRGVSFIVINSIVTGEEMARINLNEGGTSFINLDLSLFNSGVYSYTLLVNGIKEDVKKMVIVK
jgi:hypothetical protein